MHNIHNIHMAIHIYIYIYSPIRTWIIKQIERCRWPMLDTKTQQQIWQWPTHSVVNVVVVTSVAVAVVVVAVVSLYMLG